MLVIFKFTHICTSIFYHISSCNLAFPCDIIFLLLDIHPLRTSPREENGNPLQYSCLENPMDRGAWWATVHGGRKVLDTTEQLTHTTL